MILSRTVRALTFAILPFAVAHTLHAQVAGSLDPAFKPSVAGGHQLVRAIAVQPDGKILLGGEFTTVNGEAHKNLTQLNADGTVESATNFNPGSGPNDIVSSLAVQADGKILLAGGFFTVNGQPRNRIARLNADGTLESTATFNPGTGANNSVLGIAVQADRKILLGGFFTNVNGQPRSRIARLLPDGSLEGTATFTPGTGLADVSLSPALSSVAVQADGKIVLGGFFSGVNGQPRNNIARLNANGTVESTATFNAGTGVSGVWGSLTTVDCVAVHADGKILLGGLFNSVNGEPRNNIARLNADGTVESTATFDPGTGANGAAVSIAVQADGKILLGGHFSSVNGTTRNRIARLTNDAATQSLITASSARVEWARGGAAPEVEQVTFELLTNGGASWSLLGAGTRIPGGWERIGPSLPANGSLRARGRTSGGEFNGSSGLVESIAPFSFDTPFGQWKLARLGNAAALNDSDTDGDGLRTIIEYVAGSDPLLPGALPTASIAGGYLALTFPRNTAATDVTLTVQASYDLLTWSDLARSTGGAEMEPLLPSVLITETGDGIVRTVEVLDLLSYGPPHRFLRLHAAP